MDKQQFDAAAQLLAYDISKKLENQPSGVCLAAMGMLMTEIVNECRSDLRWGIYVMLIKFLKMRIKFDKKKGK